MVTDGASGQAWHPGLLPPIRTASITRKRKESVSDRVQPSLFGGLAEAPEAETPEPASIATDDAFRLVDVATASGLKAKARDLIAAIRLLKTLEAEEREAITDEKQVLARFTGFGAVANHIFPEPGTARFKAGWETLGRELQTLLDEEEYASAKCSTFNAFYTAPEVMQAIYDALAHLGVGDEAARVLEPGCGIGNFIGMAPDSMQFVGVEMETLSGRIARKLYPQHEIRIENFKATRLPPGSIDLVVGNVPFSNLKLNHNGTALALHNYFWFYRI